MRAMAEDVIARIKYATCVAAAEQDRAAPSSFDASLRAFLASRQPEARKRAKAKGAALLTMPTAARTLEFGRYANVKVPDYVAAGFDRIPGGMIDLKPDADAIRSAFEAFRNLLAKEAPPKIVTLKPPDPADPDLKAGLEFKKLRPFVRAVRCVEETDEIGADNIWLGGVAAAPTGDSWVIEPFKVSGDFDEGERVTYPGLGHKLTGWNMWTEPPWPKVYGIALAMAEKDDGGFYKFILELWNKVKEELTALIGAGIGAAIGGAIGGVLGAVVGAVVGLIIGWIVSLFDNEDDIVGTKNVTMTLVSAKKSYYDWAQLTSAEGLGMLLHYYGDGGHYRVALGWKVFKE